MSATASLKRNCLHSDLKTELELESLVNYTHDAPDLFDLLLQNEDYEIEFHSPSLPKLKKAKGCNCSKSGCLKMYCQCFAKGKQCGAECGCLSCGNNDSHGVTGQDTEVSGHLPGSEKAIKIEKMMLMRSSQSRKGCTCKKSGCQKRYCQCFAQNMKCTEHCHCVNCNNCSHNDSTSGEMVPEL